MPSEKSDKLSPLWATNETKERVIRGVKFVFNIDPPASEVRHIVRRYGNNIDELYRELAKLVIKEPKITNEDWEKMSSKIQNEIISEVLEATGLDALLFRVFRS